MLALEELGHAGNNESVRDLAVELRQLSANAGTVATDRRHQDRASHKGIHGSTTATAAAPTRIRRQGTRALDAQGLPVPASEEPRIPVLDG
ncbi:hypothetical protein AB4144_33740, partial [Rhizobiaceae sp. 2RAB30]